MPCSGYPDACSSHDRDEAQCGVCGCDWVWIDPIWECEGTPDPCSAHNNQNDCEDCGCDWTVPGINVKINIGGVWKDASEMKINIGGVWKTVTKIQINIGDTWKTVYQA